MRKPDITIEPDVWSLPRAKEAYGNWQEQPGWRGLLRPFNLLCILLPCLLLAWEAQTLLSRKKKTSTRKVNQMRRALAELHETWQSRRSMPILVRSFQHQVLFCTTGWALSFTGSLIDLLAV